MFKRIVGYIFFIAVIALIVMTVLDCGSYKSMLPEDMFKFGQADAKTLVQTSAQESERSEPMEVSDTVTVQSETTGGDEGSEDDAAEVE